MKQLVDLARQLALVAPDQATIHGYYDSYCYLPLYIFCGEHLLCARLRTADQDAAAGCVEEIARIIKEDTRSLAEHAHRAAGRFGVLPQ